MTPLPSGTVTFLFTDIEGSTRRWEESPEDMAQTVERHDTTIRSAVAPFGGHVFATSGDGFSIAFRRAHDAVEAAVAAQLALAGDPQVGTAVRVRMAIHTGEAEERDGDYFGAALSETGRLVSVGSGGQMLVSEATREVLGSRSPAGVGFLDLGEHRLRDVPRPLRVFQIVDSRLPGRFPPLSTLEPMRGNLPVPMTSFVGRDQEQAELEKLVRGSRLVTVTGAGGTGKTRLAIEVASGLADEYPDGLWFADFGTLADPDLVVSAVARVLGVSDQSGEHPLEMVLGRAKPMQALLVLDNCEHLLERIRPLVAALVREGRRLRILTTSRERLGIQGEVVWPLPPMETPDSRVPFEDLRFFDAIRLFEARAAAASPGFRLNPDIADAVGRICRYLDGIPLGIELAATRLTSLSPEDIAMRLKNSLAILGHAGTDVVAHHRSLQAALEWSYELLDTSEQALLRRLAVFSDGWTLEAAEDIGGGGDAPAIDLLSSLVDKSLVSVLDGPTGRRYRLLAPVGSFLASVLDTSGERAATEELHAGYFARFAEEQLAESFAPPGTEGAWLARLEAEIGNLRRALEWHLRVGETDRGALMAGALYRFWLRSRRFSEAIDWRDRFIAAGPTPGRPLARALLAGVAVDHWRLDEAVGLFRELGPPEELSSVLEFAGVRDEVTGNWQKAALRYGESATAAFGPASEVFLGARLGRLTAYLGDIDTGTELAIEALRGVRSLGSPFRVYSALLTVGHLEALRGNHGEAYRAFEEALDYETRGGTRVMLAGRALGGLAEVALLAGDAPRCLSYLRRLCDQARSMPYGEPLTRLAVAANGIQIRGEIDIARDEHRRGVRLLAADTAFRESRAPWHDLPWVRDPFRQQRVDAALDTARAALGETAFAAAWSEGAALTPQEAIDLTCPSPSAP